VPLTPFGELVRDLEMMAAILNRAQRRLAGAAAVELDRQQGEAAQQQIARIQKQLQRINATIPPERQRYVEPSPTHLELHTQGVSKREMARVLEISRVAVRKVLKSSGERSARPDPHPEEKAIFTAAPELTDYVAGRKVLGTLNEAQRRWLVGREALRCGRGGIERMVETSGRSKPTILKGIQELRGKGKLAAEEGRVRNSGGGRKPIEEHDPELTRLLEKVMDESTVGDPMSPLKWNGKSTYQIQQYLAARGHSVSEDNVQRRLRMMEYSLQDNRKDKEGVSHTDRDRQFRYLSESANRLLARGEPVISVDTKKKERVGNFKNNGRKLHKKGQSPKVNVHDFSSLAKGTAIPYGAYDVYRNEGMVNVGMTHDTAEFAVESIRRWWRQFGVRHYPGAQRLLICADSGPFLVQDKGRRVEDWEKS